jgi:hypothetical protein
MDDYLSLRGRANVPAFMPRRRSFIPFFVSAISWRGTYFIIHRHTWDVSDSTVYRLNAHGEVIGKWTSKTACARDFGCDPQTIVMIMDGT